MSTYVRRRSANYSFFLDPSSSYYLQGFLISVSFTQVPDSCCLAKNLTPVLFYLYSIVLYYFPGPGLCGGYEVSGLCTVYLGFCVVFTWFRDPSILTWAPDRCIGFMGPAFCTLVPVPIMQHGFLVLYC
jgi:hypothetical protein